MVDPPVFWQCLGAVFCSMLSTADSLISRFVKDFGAYDPKLQQYNISASNQTLLTGTPLALACVAAWISGPLGTYFGRRFGLAASAIASLIGPSVQAGATKWYQVVLGRCISGIGIGFAYNFSLAYWSESTPASLRGSVVVMYQGITNVAQFVAQCVNQGTHEMNNRWAYRIPLLLELIAPALLIGFFSGYRTRRVRRILCHHGIVLISSRVVHVPWKR